MSNLDKSRSGADEADITIDELSDRSRVFVLVERDKAAERSRNFIAAGLLGYLVIWSVATVYMIVTDVPLETVVALVTIFVSPVLSLIAAVVGFWFGRQNFSAR